MDSQQEKWVTDAEAAGIMGISLRELAILVRLDLIETDIPGYSESSCKRWKEIGRQGQSALIEKARAGHRPGPVRTESRSRAGQRAGETLPWGVPCEPGLPGRGRQPACGMRHGARRTN